MARNEGGEYELVVGNKHLLSVVFILMVLFGIFFSLGYFVGRNSSEVATVEPPLTIAKGTVSQPREAPPEPAQKAMEEPLVPGEAKVEASKAVAEPPAPEPKPEPPPAPVARVKQAAAEPSVGETYLQVIAAKRSTAEVYVDVLKQKGFSALMAPVPGGDLYRALVGPVKDSTDLARLRSELEAAGFKPHVRKY
jgi:cell division protein FtsN